MIMMYINCKQIKSRNDTPLRFWTTFILFSKFHIMYSEEIIEDMKTIIEKLKS